MRTIARSSAYQLSSRFDGEWKESYTPYFARNFVRQLTAEQIHDAISQATQVFGNYKRKDYVYDTPIAPGAFLDRGRVARRHQQRRSEGFPAHIRPGQSRAVRSSVRSARSCRR